MECIIQFTTPSFEEVIPFSISEKSLSQKKGLPVTPRKLHAMVMEG